MFIKWIDPKLQVGTVNLRNNRGPLVVAKNEPRACHVLRHSLMVEERANNCKDPDIQPIIIFR